MRNYSTAKLSDTQIISVEQLHLKLKKLENFELTFERAGRRSRHERDDDESHHSRERTKQQQATSNSPQYGASAQAQRENQQTTELALRLALLHSYEKSYTSASHW